MIHWACGVVHYHVGNDISYQLYIRRRVEIPIQHRVITSILVPPSSTSARASSISYTALRQSQNFQNKNQFQKYSGSLYTNELRLLPVPRREPSHSHFEVFKTPPSSTSHVLLINVNTKGSVRVVTPPTMKMEANACQRATNSRRMIALH